MLVGAMNPCPCGYFGDATRECKCPPSAVTKYQSRLSGPFLDRVDIFVEVPRVDYEKLSGNHCGEKSASIQERVRRARTMQRERYKESRFALNSEMTPQMIEKDCALDSSTQSLLKTAVNKFQLSARGYHRILKMARTIADLEASEAIKLPHVAEALQYRPRWNLS